MSTNPPPMVMLNSAFAQDVRKGLTADSKFLLSRYFYDERGDGLFQEIMELPEYYPTRSEFEIFHKHKADILDKIKEPFDLVELGAGDGQKTQVLIEHFIQEQTSFEYFPIDISGSVLQHLKDVLHERWPQLGVRPIEGTYFDSLEKIGKLSDCPKLVLFLGSNIGNMKESEAILFLQQLRKKMRSGDKLLLGVDLKKDPQTILSAYNDEKGVTREFNLNLLKRINRELDADFDLSTFFHWPTYDPISGDTKSHLVSKVEQVVKIRSLGMYVHFKAWEAIDMELSKKYDKQGIEKLADLAGFDIVHWFYDQKNYFTDVLLQV